MQNLTPEIVEDLLNQWNGRNPQSKVSLHLAKTKSEHAKVREVAFRAFREYALYEWISEGLPRDKKDEIVDFFGNFVNRLCRTLGYVFFAKDKETGEIVGSAQFEDRHYSQNAILKSVKETGAFMVNVGSMLFGSSGIPWFLFKSNPGAVNLKDRCRGFDALERAHNEVIPPHEHHLYLIMISCEPAREGQGIGRAILDGLATLADAIQVPIYLETDDEKLKNWYVKAGYELKREYEVPDPIQPFVPNYGMLKPAFQPISQ